MEYGTVWHGVRVFDFLKSVEAATAREVAVAVFGEEAGITGRSKAYMRSYNWLRSLECDGAVTRVRVDLADGPRGCKVDYWSAVPDAVVEPRPMLTPPALWSERRPSKRPMEWRHIRLSERMWLTLLGVLNDACIDDPTDIALRKLRNVCKAGRKISQPDDLEEVAQ